MLSCGAGLGPAWEARVLLWLLSEPKCAQRRGCSGWAEDAAAPLRGPGTLRRPPPAACVAVVGHRRGRTNVNLLFVPSPFINSQHHKEVRHPHALRKFSMQEVWGELGD